MSTPALVPSFCSIGTILPPRPARASCRRAQWRSRMARLRATASAARSVLDGREHDGRLSMASKQHILRLIDAGGEVRRAPLVGVEFLHEPAVGATDLLR